MQVPSHACLTFGKGPVKVAGQLAVLISTQCVAFDTVEPEKILDLISSRWALSIVVLMWSFATGVADRLPPAIRPYRGNQSGNRRLATSTFLNRQPAQVRA